MTDIRRLEGAHILLTGATGFVGQAILERLLSSFTDTTVSVLVRPKGPARAQARVDRLIRKPVFGPWLERVGKDAALSALHERVEVIEGDIGELSEKAAKADVVIHSAASVTFDPPIDRAFAGNVGGAERLYTSLLAAGADPHVVHVSTTYVNGALRGLVLEAPVDHDVDWRSERDAALAARERVEFASRGPAVLGRLQARAQREVGKIGPHAVSEATEAARREWVDRQLVARGRSRAESLGWTDAYTLTKAMAERVAEELWAQDGHRLSVVRPAIVESALRHPFPGWIDGFKVADPLILAYGRGQLSDFPGVPDSVLDIVPVDFVVNAILAAAATPPEPASPTYYHVASGARNPLPFHRMYEDVNAFFTKTPIASEDGPIRAPRWEFRGGIRFDSRLQRQEKGVEVAESLVAQLPRGKRVRRGLDAFRKRRAALDVLRKHAELYRVYVQSEVIFDDAKLRGLNASLPAEIADDFGFDMNDIDWDTYLLETHFPAVTELAHAFNRRSSEATKKSKALPAATDVLAVFDLEGTVLRANLVDQYRWLRMTDGSLATLPAEAARLLSGVPRFLAAEKRDRSEFIRTFMRLYEGMSVRDIRAAVQQGPLGRRLQLKLVTDALARAQEHRRAGHRTVLVTGTSDLFADAVAPYFDEVIATGMQERGGVLTGYLAAPPLVGESRAAWLRHYAAERGFDLSRSFGYGDSYADTSWLELVGHPIAVNPDSNLYRFAREKRWPVMEWEKTGVQVAPFRPESELRFDEAASDKTPEVN
ncbi:MAG: SDR family oxidoreductase [Microbacterium sp.]